MRYSPKWSRFACIALMLSLLFTGVALSQPSLGIVAKLMTIPFIQTVQDWQALSPRWGLLTLVFGLLSMAGSFASPRHRRGLLVSGLVLLLGGFLPILLLLLPLVSRWREIKCLI